MQPGILLPERIRQSQYMFDSWDHTLQQLDALIRVD